ncbi:hypothetical protein T440DRAFT_467679 [Plenodomus tracheiphilus IPT5]|uniref:DUF4211 domain-containing protein n=1 Tax=Plenodomus tracheiphilus IPT5 TaxID=1408161 RepID=A0A6A7BB52_9PLEO|nr:hypothetical protein T440DRAFT_467679 [Plenodomus tracheiphilus IPT5]
MAPKAARGRKRQTKISFSPTAKPSTSTGSTATAKMGNAPSQPEDHAPKKPTPTTPTKPMPRKSTRATKPVFHDSFSEDELAGNVRLGKKLHTPMKREQNGMFGSSDLGFVDSESSEDREKQQKEPQPKPASRKRQRAASGSESSHGRPAVTIVPRKKQRIIKVREESEEEEQDKEGEDEVEHGEDEAEHVKQEEEEMEEEDAPKSNTRRRELRRRHTPEDTIEVQVPSRSARRRQARRPSPASDEDEVLVLPRPRRAKPAREQTPSDEGSKAQAPPKSSRRRITRRAPPSDSEDQDDEGAELQSDGNDNERNELKEDLAFLKSSPLPDRGRLRSTHDKPKNERQRALEALKRKRAGATEPPSSATPIRKKPVVVETDSDSDLEVIQEEPEGNGLIGDELEDDDDPEDDEREPNVLDIFQEGKDDIEFIDDNADALIGEPTAEADLDDMRLAFSLSRAKTKDLFKHAVEWMVMKKIHPAFESTRNFYTLTFRKLDDEVKGLAGSKFTSSAWTPEFTRAVRARPDLITNEIGGAADFMSPHCAACNRKNHPATWEIMLTGQPYDKDTLEPLENDNSSDSDSDSDSSSLSASPPRNANNEKPERDASGEILLPESHRFFLGSTCKANAQVSHTLYHWRYHLYQWVKQYLAQQGHLTAEKLVKRDKSSNRKREKAAIKIVDQMEADGEIKKLWRLYKEQVTFAVEASNEYKDGWGRR